MSYISQLRFAQPQAIRPTGVKFGMKNNVPVDKFEPGTVFVDKERELKPHQVVSNEGVQADGLLHITATRPAFLMSQYERENRRPTSRAMTIREDGTVDAQVLNRDEAEQLAAIHLPPYSSKLYNEAQWQVVADRTVAERQALIDTFQVES